MTAIVSILLTCLGSYLLLGVLFGAVFSFKGAKTVDATALQSPSSRRDDVFARFGPRRVGDLDLPRRIFDQSDLVCIHIGRWHEDGSVPIPGVRFSAG
ncbi:MAG: hypothetical protein ACI9UA_003748 [Pseudoalteromonas tetraodonis]|jgi:hypothetical protein